jgi:hypothetical protein
MAEIDADPPCDWTGSCRPYAEDVESNETQSSCVHCGKQLVLVREVWKTWDWDLLS